MGLTQVNVHGTQWIVCLWDSSSCLFMGLVVVQVMGLLVHGTHSGDCLWDSMDCLFMGLVVEQVMGLFMGLTQMIVYGTQWIVYGTSSSVGHGIVHGTQMIVRGTQWIVC